MANNDYGIPLELINNEILLSEWDAGIRLYNILNNDGYMFVAQILQRTKDDLMNLKGFGDGSYKKLVQFLDRRGISEDLLGSVPSHLDLSTIGKIHKVFLDRNLPSPDRDQTRTVDIYVESATISSSGIINVTVKLSKEMAAALKARPISDKKLAQIFTQTIESVQKPLAEEIKNVIEINNGLD